MKKYLIYAGMFVASFLVINVGMYFFLSFTQPEIAAVTEAEGDSLLAEDVSDSLSTETSAEAEAFEEPASTLIASSGEAPDSTTAPGSAEEMPKLAEVVIIDSSDSFAVEEPAADSSASTISELPVAGAELPSDAMSPENEAALAEVVPTETVQPAGLQAPQGDPKQLAKLAKLLEGMKPDEAAAIASRLQIDEIVSLVMKMKNRQAAKLLAALPIDKAARVAERMSEIGSGTGTNS